MYRFGNPYTVVMGVIGLLMLGLATAIARRRSRRVALPLAGFTAGAGLWAVGDAVRIAAPTEAEILLWNKVAYLGVVLIPPSYLFFIAAVTNRERWFRRRYVYGLVGFSALAYAVILTNPFDLWRASEVFSPGTSPPVLVEIRGLGWYVWAIYTYSLVAGGVFVLVGELVRSSRSSLYRKQVGTLLVGILVPWLTNMLFVVFDVLQFDPVPITMSGTGLAFAAAIYRYDLLDIAPIARDIVLSNLDSGVVVLDAGDRIVDANRRARAVLDLDDGAVPGATLEAVLDGYPDVADRLRSARETSETVAVDADDGQYHFEVEVSPIEDGLGTTLGRVVVFTDVTDRIRREDELEERTERLRRRNERLDELASIVSHDLRNPLDVTGRRARRLRSLVEDADLDGETRAAVESELDGIERATGRASDIAGELLSKSRDPSGGDDDRKPGAASTSAPDPAPARTTLRTAATDAWDTVETGDLSLSVRGSRALAADESDLRHLLENCFRNVVDHADGATTVTVGATGDGFYVEDDGDGVPESERERVFERGYSMAADGSGLGLSIVETVAEEYDWSVDLSEGRTGGTRVDVTTDPGDA